MVLMVREIKEMLHSHAGAECGGECPKGLIHDYGETMAGM